MDFRILSGTPLFEGIAPDEVEHVTSCLNAREKAYQKDEVILHAGSTVSELGLVESGSANVVVNFYWGDSRIFGHVGAGQVFAENYAAVPGRELVCDVVAAQDCQILFLSLDRLLAVCQSGCGFHQRLVRNLLGVSASRSLELSSRMMHTAPRGLRDRLTSYLSEQATLNGSTHFRIPFDRQQLADYLGADRSALSSALSKMQRDGLIAYRKNEFWLRGTR